MSVVVSNQNKLPHSHIAVCANSRPRYQCFHVLNCTYARSRNLRPCLPQACAEAACAIPTNHAASAAARNIARRVSTIPAGSMALVRLGRYCWPSRQASLPSIQHQPLSRPSLPLPMCMPAPIRTFEERTPILAAVR